MVSLKYCPVRPLSLCWVATLWPSAKKGTSRGKNRNRNSLFIGGCLALGIECFFAPPERSGGCVAVLQGLSCASREPQQLEQSRSGRLPNGRHCSTPVPPLRHCFLVSLLSARPS